jgi:transcription antitermination factor NusG
MSRWYCVRTATRKEAKAVASLSELHLHAYCPMETRERKTPRGARLIEIPLFSGYIFALLDDNGIADAHDAEGIHKVMGVDRQRGGEQVASWVHAIQAAERAGQFDRTKTTVQRFEIGERVRVSVGKYGGIVGTLVEMQPNARAKLIYEMFGREHQVIRPLSELDAA